MRLHHPISVSYGYLVQPTNAWSFSWDITNDLLLASTDPESSRAEFEYTNGLIAAAHRVVSTNQNLTTRYSYNTNGWLTAGATNANGAWVRYTYDGVGNLDAITPAAGPAVSFEHDALGYITQMDLPGASGTRSTVFDPDPVGRVQSITYPARQEFFAYDAVDRVTNHTDTAGRVTRFEYDRPSAKLSAVIRELSSGGSTQTVAVRFGYDSLFNTLSITDALGRAVETYEFDSENRRPRSQTSKARR